MRFVGGLSRVFILCMGGVRGRVFCGGSILWHFFNVRADLQV